MESYERQTKDSDTIFNVISEAANNLDEAKKMWVLYVMDDTFSRSGCSHALNRLERHYAPKQ